MTEYTKLFVRAGERYQAPGLFSEQIFQRRDRKRRNQRIGTVVLVTVLTVAAIGGLMRAFTSVDGSLPANSPTVLPAVDPGEPLIIPAPPGYEVRMTPGRIREIEAYVYGLIARHEERLGKAIVAPRIISIQYLEPNESLDGWFSDSHGRWAVKFEGTIMHCVPYCRVASGGTLVLMRHGDGFWEKAGAFPDTVCYPGPQHFPEKGSHVDLPDCSEIPGAPTP